VEAVSFLDPVLSLLARYNLSLSSVALAVVILYAIGVDFTFYNKLMGFSVPSLAAGYAVAIFVLDKVGSSVYPRLHPDVSCERCKAKQLHIISATIRCEKCQYIYKVGNTPTRK
jgi:hypothetical protein